MLQLSLFVQIRVGSSVVEKIPAKDIVVSSSLTRTVDFTTGLATYRECIILNRISLFIFHRYKITGKEMEIESLKIHWSCHYGDNETEEEHFADDLEYDSRGYEIVGPKQK